MLIHDLATDLAGSLSIGCRRISIAGSIRRFKANPRDIEIVCIPDLFTEVEKDLFGNVISTNMTSHLDLILETLTNNPDSGWEFDPVVRRNGDRYKRLRHTSEHNSEDRLVPCDLFITDVERWGVIYTIRTGPATFSQMLATRALKMGMKVDDGRLWEVHRDGSRVLIPTPEEIDFFVALKYPWTEPKERA